MNKDELKINQRAEAVARMHLLNMNTWPNVISDFQNNGTVWTSSDPAGDLLKGDTDTETAIKEFHQLHSEWLVYHAINGKYKDSDGTEYHLVSLLFVDDIPNEWHFDRDDITRQRPYAFAYNVDVPEYSETGTIGIMQNGNAYRRTY